jgi:hypothetical protein
VSGGIEPLYQAVADVLVRYVPAPMLMDAARAAVAAMDAYQDTLKKPDAPPWSVAVEMQGAVAFRRDVSEEMLDRVCDVLAPTLEDMAAIRLSLPMYRALVAAIMAPDDEDENEDA